MMTIKDVTSVEHLPVFTRFVFDLVYPKERESSPSKCACGKCKCETDKAAKDAKDAADAKAKKAKEDAKKAKEAKEAKDAKDAKTGGNTGDKSSTKTGTARLLATDPPPAAGGAAGKATTATPTDTCAGMPAGAKCSDGDMTFLAEFNYFCGMKINVREAAMAANTDEQSRRVISDVKPADLGRDALVDYTGSLLRHIDAAAAKDKTGYDAAQAALVEGYWKDTAPADQTYSQYFAGDLSRTKALAGL